MRDFLFVLFFVFFICTISTPKDYEKTRDYRNHDNHLSTNYNQPTNLNPLKKQTTGTNDVWTELHPKVPRVNYWGVYFMNPDTGLAVGEQGTLIKTTTGGGKWYQIEIDYNKTIRTIGSYSGEKIIAAGDSGLIIISTDYGNTWQVLQSGTSQRLWNIQMLNNKVGWLVGEGSTALKTTDGGYSWVNQPTPLIGYPYWDVSFLDTSFGYICSSVGQILRTTDGGLNWDVKQAGDQYALTTIKAVTRQKAVALGFAGKHVYTTNGGETWQFITYLGSTFRKMAFIDTLKGFAVGYTGSFETTNGGFTWNLRLDIKSSKYITFTNEEVGYLVGDRLILEKTTNAGQNWFRTIINDDFTDVFFTNEQNGWFIGNNLYQTTDGGETLITRNDFPGNRPSSVYFLDSLTGVVGAQDKIFKTHDGGITWEEKNINGITGNAGEYIRLFFINDSVGWALSYGYVVKTTDGGENWHSQLNAGGLRGVHFSDALNGWVTRGGKPFKTTDGGETWIEQSNFPASNAWDVFFNDSLNGFISRSNELYKTTDGGIIWSLIQNVTNYLYGRFSNLYQNSLFLAGVPRTYQSTDAGANWEEVIELRDQFVECIRLLEINNGYAVGRTGLIIRLTDSIVNVGENHTLAPEEFHLYQNYPNPFNNSTSISFKLPEYSRVKIIIYDTLGRQIKVLVNKEFQLGFHSVNFSAENLSSGIYLYKMEGGGFSEVRKMILLK